MFVVSQACGRIRMHIVPDLRVIIHGQDHLGRGERRRRGFI